MMIFDDYYFENNDIEIFSFNKENLKAKKDFIFVKSQIEALVANQFGIKFLVSKDLKLLAKLQKLAEDYLFDSKITALISSKNDLQELIDARIDAVIIK